MFNTVFRAASELYAARFTTRVPPSTSPNVSVDRLDGTFPLMFPRCPRRSRCRRGAPARGLAVDAGPPGFHAVELPLVLVDALHTAVPPASRAKVGGAKGISQPRGAHQWRRCPAWEKAAKTSLRGVWKTRSRAGGWPAPVLEVVGDAAVLVVGSFLERTGLPFA